MGDGHDDILRDHSERLAKLEVHVERVVTEVTSIRRAIWFLAFAVMMNAGPNLKETMKVLSSIVG